MTEPDLRSCHTSERAQRASECDPRQEAYADYRLFYTSMFRAWFRAWSDYEAMWWRIMLEEREDVPSK